MEKTDDGPVFKTLPIRFSLFFHKRVKSAAKKTGKGITQFVLSATLKAVKEVENGK